MHPVEIAALIGVGGSVLVAVVSVITMAWTTNRTLEADRGRRLWDKETSAYELVLGELMRRQTRRLKAQFGEKDLELMAEYFENQNSPGWVQAEAMLLAYAPQSIMDALEASREAFCAAARPYEHLQELRQQSRAGRPPGEPLSTFRELMDAVVQADQADQALANAVRKQLGMGLIRLPLPSDPEPSWASSS